MLRAAVEGSSNYVSYRGKVTIGMKHYCVKLLAQLPKLCTLKCFLFYYPTRDLQGSLKLMEQGVTTFT